MNESEEAYPLVLAGGKGWLEDDLNEFVTKLDIVEKVKLLGYVSDDTLKWMYGNCFGFIFPSLYEGFGLPVLEAMSQGASVICSNVTSMPEVAGDAAHFINPLSEKEIADAIFLLAENEEYRLNLKKLALRQAQKFSWHESAKKVTEVYNHIMVLGKR